MTKILGLDLGVASIGWALIEEADSPKIIGMGSRILPLSTDDKDEFVKGNAISKNQKRTLRRTQRKGYDRYQLRRKYLTEELKKAGLIDPELFNIGQQELWALRAKAVTERISKEELGRVLFHLNQKRGYKSSRSEANMNKQETAYVAEVKTRHQLLLDTGLTIGQFFARELAGNRHYRVRAQVYPRAAYMDEFDAIWACQQKFYPEILTSDLRQKIRNEIIYFQRALRSQKGLVSICEFEGRPVDKGGKKIYIGPKVAPRSSPIFQLAKILETVNHLSFTNRAGHKYVPDSEQRNLLVQVLSQGASLKDDKILKLLGLNKADGWSGTKQTERGIQGDTTMDAFRRILPADSPWLVFAPKTITRPGETFLVDRGSGETRDALPRQELDPDLEQEPLYRLWHVIYSIADQDECARTLIQTFNIPEDQARKLAALDLTRSGFGNKSAKAMRKMIPYLQLGYVYSDAAELAGYRNTGALTRDERDSQMLLDRIPILAKNSLRQPVVEKIVNQMINLVNRIIEVYGRPDEIRVELARELKQGLEERNQTFQNLSKRERENEIIRSRIEGEYGLRATRTNVIKWRLFQEISGEESKVNAVCIYCGQPFGLSAALSGEEVDEEHIIPKSLLFDDSQSNKTLAHRKCNQDKGDRTALDYMQTRGKTEFEDYLQRVDRLYKARIIGKRKRDYLLMPQSKIPKDFIERQLRETQYITKKARAILGQVCRRVWCTSGQVTDYLRRLWGWDEVIMNLRLPGFREAGLVKTVSRTDRYGQQHQIEVVEGWTKRDDHRHHALDALVIACTKQGFIQRLNTLSASATREAMYAEIADLPPAQRQRRSLLELYLARQQPFHPAIVQEEVSRILVSFKPGKRVAVKGKRFIRNDGKRKLVQSGITVPRGALSEESVYGRIRTMEFGTLPKHFFRFPELIVKDYIRKFVEDRLSEYQGDYKKALASIKTNPIWLDEAKTKPLTHATCYREEYVIKYALETIQPDHVETIVDKHVRQLVAARLEQAGGKPKDAFREPLFHDAARTNRIRSVRRFTGLSAVEPLRSDDRGAYAFVKPGNNHHVAIYRTADGDLVEHICTLWQAVQRVRIGLPAVITDPASAWDTVLRMGTELGQEFLKKLPPDTSTLILSLQQNELFLLGWPESESLTIENVSPEELSPYLYRVQKLASGQYIFRHHLNTSSEPNENDRILKQFIQVSVSSLMKLRPIAVRIDVIGQILTTKRNDPKDLSLR